MTLKGLHVNFDSFSMIHAQERNTYTAGPHIVPSEWCLQLVFCQIGLESNAKHYNALYALMFVRSRCA